MKTHPFMPGPTWLKRLQAHGRSVQLGIDDAGRVVLLDDRQRAQHTYVLGKSGVGKTMLLATIVLQDLLRRVPVVFLDLIGTAVPYLRQCLASINLAGLAAERGPYPALSERRRREREQFFRAIRILDLDTATPLDRFNPLEPLPGMTTFELAEAFAAAIERMLGGKLSEMRALHLNLVGLASVVIDSGGTLQDMVDLCCLDTETLRQYLRRLERRRARGRLGIPVRRDLVTRYMSEVFAATSGRERRELCASTLRALALILSDSVAREFLSAPRGNLNLQAVLDGEQSLLINVPPRNLHTQTVIASLFLSRLSGLAMRRSSQDAAEGRLPQVHVVIDEFQRVFTEELAADLAVLRNKGLSMILAHQSSNQPPFHTPEGQAMLNSIGDNCSTKLLMCMGQKDAREHAGAAYTPRGHLAKRQTQEVTRTTGESLASTMSRAEAEGQSRTEGCSRTQSRTASFSRARTHSSSASQGTQTSHTRGQTQTRTEGESEGSSSTISSGQTRGSSFTHTEGHSQSSGESSGVGESHSQGVGRSNTVQETSGQGVGQRPDGGYQIQQNRSLGRTLGDSASEGQSHSHHRSENRSSSSSHSKAHGISQSRSWSRADGRSSTRSVGRSEGESQSRTEGTSHTHTEGEAHARTQGLSQGYGQSHSYSQGSSRTRTATMGASESRSQGTSVREVTEYYSVMEETIVRGYELQSLPNRSVIVLRQGAGENTMQRMRTLDMPQELVTRLGPLDGLLDLERLIAPPPAEPEPALDIVERLRLQTADFRGEDE